MVCLVTLRWKIVSLLLSDQLDRNKGPKIKLLLISITALGIGRTLYILEDAYPFLTTVCHYLPDGLWGASLTALICCIWKNDSRMKIGWCAAGVLSMIGFEIAQYLNAVGGTGDIFDCLVYIVASSTIIYLDSKRWATSP